MAITVKCGSCDKKYQVRDDAAGKSIVCKECGEKIRVPNARSKRPAQADDDEFAIPEAEDDEFAPLAPRKSPSRAAGRSKGSRQASSGNMKVVWIACGAGAALLVIVVLLVSLLGRGGGTGNDVAQENGQGGGDSGPGGAKPQGMRPAGGAPAGKPGIGVTISGKWKVTVDPAGELPAFLPDASVNAPIPNTSLPEIVYADCPSAHVAVGSNPGKNEAREVYDLRNNSRLGAIRNTVINSGKRALSPDGRYFAAWTFTETKVPLFDVIGEKLLGELPANGDTTPRLLMFAGNDRLIASSDKEEILVWSIPDGKSVRTIPRPKVIGDPVVGLSPGGKFLATGFEEHPKKFFIRVINLATGDTAGEITLSELDDGNPRCQGIAFSRDGAELAALYDSFKESRIVTFNVADGKLMTHGKMEGSLKSTLKAYSASSQQVLEWFPNKKRLFVYGCGIFDRAAGKVIWTMPDEKPGTEPIRRVLDDEHVLTVAGERRKNAAVVSFGISSADLERSAEVVKSGGLPIDAALPKLTAAEWAGGTAVPLDGAARGWSVSPDPALLPADPLLPKPLALTSTSATVKSAMLSGSAAARAVILNAIRNPSGPSGKTKGKANAKPAADRESPVWLTVVDLTAGKEIKTVEIPYECELTSVSPDGKRALVRLAEGQSRVDVWSLDDGQHVVGWRPYLNEKDNDQIIRHSAFVDGDHVATIGGNGKFAVWALPACRAVYTIERAHDAWFSPNRKIVAIPEGSKAVRFFDALTGAARGDVQSGGRLAAAAFHPDGTRFAGAFATGIEHRLVCWNLQDGKIETEFPLPDSGRSMHFCGDNHLLLDTRVIIDSKTEVDARLLIDLEHQMIVWRYDPAGGLHVADSPDARHWFLALPSARATAVNLVAAALPDAQAQGKLAKAKFEPEMVVKPGSRITLRMALAETPPAKSSFAQDVTRNFNDTLTNNKITLADGESVVMTVSMKNIKSGKNVDYQISEFVGGKVTNRNISIPESVVECSVQVSRSAKVLWERKMSFANRAMFFQTVQGKTPEQHLNDQMWETAANFLLQFRPPAHVFADSAFNGLGSSPLNVDSAAAVR